MSQTVLRITLLPSLDNATACSQYIMLKFFITSHVINDHSVLPLFSLPLLLAGGSTQEGIEGSPEPIIADCQPIEQLQLVTRAVGAHAIRSHSLPICQGEMDSEVYVLECPGSLGIGGKVWDATFVLLDFLRTRPHMIKSRRVIELGSGTGLAGVMRTLVCWRLFV